MNLRFSIIVPVYNVASYLRECLDSVASQTFSNWECVCVDDGSTDGSGAILDEYSAKDSRFKVVHQENAGVGSARNHGLNLISGDWFVFIDSDDVVKSTILSDFRSVILRHHSADIVTTRMMKLPETATAVWADIPLERGMLEICDIRERLHPYCLEMGIVGTAYKRSCFGELRFGKWKIGEDLVFTCQCFARSSFLILVNVEEYAYRQRATSASWQRMTEEVLCDMISYRPAMFHALDSSKKIIPKGFTRVRGDKWLYYCAAILVKYGTAQTVWENAWNTWFDSMQKGCRMRILPLRQRFVMLVLASTNSRLLTKIFCSFPYMIKGKMSKWGR